jgi:hypothetical protein
MMVATMEEKARLGFILPAMLFAGNAFMANDWIVIALHPLRHLEVPFPDVLRAVPYLAAIVGSLLWLALRRRWPVLSAIAGFMLMWVMLAGVLGWADHQVEKVSITREINGIDLPPLEARLGFKVWEQGDAGGMALWVARRPGYATSLAAEIRRMESVSTSRVR